MRDWKSKRYILTFSVVLLLSSYVSIVMYLNNNMSNLDENVNYQYRFHHHRIRLWNEGRCIDSPDGYKLVVSFCDPDQTQSFSLTAANKLVYDRTGRCVGYKSFQQNASLILQNCEDTTTESLFQIANSSYLNLFTEQNVGNVETLCLSPMATSTQIKRKGGKWKEVNNNQGKSPCLNNPVAITKCDNVASRILLMEEQSFQSDRSVLRNLVVPPGDADCDFKACGLNRKTPPIKRNPDHEILRCEGPWECVTLVIKTARRPHLVVRLAQSVRDSYGYDLPIVAFDDGPDDYSDDVKQNISRYPLLNYVVGEDEDYGIAEGRNRALALVKTKYFFLLDDDVLFLKTTDMKTMVDILDTTDATLVGGQLAKRGNFAGLIKFGYFNDTTKVRKMGLFPKTCDIVNQTVPSFPSCIQCDINSNIFMARTEAVKTIGGWDPELKIFEHKDLFIKMKARGLKVATCHHIQLQHNPPAEGSPEQVDGYLEKRKRSKNPRFLSLFENRYNFQVSFYMDGQDVNEFGEVMYYSRTYKGPRC